VVIVTILSAGIKKFGRGGGIGIMNKARETLLYRGVPREII
jgi:hypothetical protein